MLQNNDCGVRVVQSLIFCVALCRLFVSSLSCLLSVRLHVYRIMATSWKIKVIESLDHTTSYNCLFIACKTTNNRTLCFLLNIFIVGYLGSMA